MLADLEASVAIALGDTAAAFARWEAGLRIFDPDELFIGMVASQWPARLSYARSVLAAGDPEKVLSLTEPFLRLVNVMDQAAWAPAMALRAEAALQLGDRNTAVDAYNKIWRILDDPDGGGILVKEDLQRALVELVQPN